MFSRHARHLNTFHLYPIPTTTTFNINKHLIEEIQIMHRRERLPCFLGRGEVRFRMRGCDDG